MPGERGGWSGWSPKQEHGEVKMSHLQLPGLWDGWDTEGRKNTQEEQRQNDPRLLGHTGIGR